MLEGCPMKRGYVTVWSISTVLAAVVVAAVACSHLVLDRTSDSAAYPPASTDSSLLVLTWGPSLCAAEPSNPVCTSGQVVGMGRTLTLHGLWPQPADNQFCGMSKALADRARNAPDSAMPPLKLSDPVRAGLQSTMANAAELASHEWYAHGTCAGVSEDQYFGDAAALTMAVRKVLDPVFNDARGGRLTLGTVRHRVDQEFGAGAGKRVGLMCQKLNDDVAVVVEVRLSLPPVADLRTDDALLSLGELLPEGPPVPSDCWHGRVR